MFMVLIGAKEDGYWSCLLRDALSSLGTLDLVPAEDANARSIDHKYDIVTVDATYVKNVEKFVSSLRREKPDRKIVVITAAPTWQQARAAFAAGAIDYLPKTLPKRDLLRFYKDISRKPPPPWSTLPERA
jgi:DNA-binding NarL/FixJ family response regulator